MSSCAGRRRGPRTGGGGSASARCEFRVVKGCDRCVMTMLDPVTADQRQGADRDTGAVPTLGRQDLVRSQPRARHPGRDAVERSASGTRSRCSAASTRQAGRCAERSERSDPARRARWRATAQGWSSAKIIRTAMAAQKPKGRRLMAGVIAGFTVAMPAVFPTSQILSPKIATFLVKLKNSARAKS